MARGRGGRAREGASRRHGRGERERECGVPVGRRCSLERNYPPRDRDEAAVALEGASGGRRGGERERGRERGKGDGVVFTRHGCSRGGVPCRAVVAPSSLLVPRYPVLRRSSIVGQIERARPQQSERASLRIRYELFSSSSSFFFPPSRSPHVTRVVVVVDIWCALKRSSNNAAFEASCPVIATRRKFEWEAFGEIKPWDGDRLFRS